MERILAIRRRIRRINYSKKTISVEFILGGPVDSTSQDLARPPDGKRVLNQNLTSVPHSGTKSFNPPARTSESNLFQTGEKLKGSGRELRSDPFQKFGLGENGNLVGLPPKFIVAFPNIAHSYWDNFRLTGEFHVRQAKAPRF
jgi:hypothetical protein